MTDIKKVLAYSTVSQLGYMMLALGVGGWAAGLFHLITHAFFKALLFLGSGSVIYGCHHEQDMMKMGGLYKKMKITALTMLMGVLAISGIPLFSGWYSKDAIIAQAAGYAYVHREHALLFILPLATAGITTFYMFRMWLMTFTGKPRDQHVHDHAHESPWMMTTPLVILAVLSVAVAWSWTPWEATSSWLGHGLHASQPAPVLGDLRRPPHLPRQQVVLRPRLCGAGRASRYGRRPRLQAVRPEGAGRLHPLPGAGHRGRLQGQREVRQRLRRLARQPRRPRHARRRRVVPRGA